MITIAARLVILMLLLLNSISLSYSQALATEKLESKKASDKEYSLSNEMVIDNTEEDTSPPIFEWQMDCHGTVSGRIIDLSDVKFSSSKLDVPIPLSIENYDLNYFSNSCPFRPCQDALLNFKFTTKNCSKKAFLKLEVKDCAGNDTILNIIYEDRMVEVEPNNINFEDANTQNTSYEDLCIYNRSFSENLNISKISFVNNSNRFNIHYENMDTIQLPLLIKPQDSIKFILAFKSSGKFPFTSDLILEDSCCTLATIPLEADTRNNSTEVIDDDDSIDIFFNHVQDELIVRSAIKSTQRIIIYDVLGNMIYYNNKINETETRIDTKDLYQGVYFLQLFSNNEIINKKFLIQK